MLKIKKKKHTTKEQDSDSVISGNRTWLVLNDYLDIIYFECIIIKIGREKFSVSFCAVKVFQEI